MLRILNRKQNLSGRVKRRVRIGVFVRIASTCVIILYMDPTRQSKWTCAFA
jgi:hypothetical protein